MKKTFAIVQMKCPRCYEGHLYTYANPLLLSHLHEMPEQCSECGLHFRPEPGFYTGAMYVSYGLSVGLFVLFFFVLHIALGVDGLAFLLSYGMSMLLLFPFLFRYSRALYIHLFYHYEPDAKARYVKK
jgi:uncharacterized protein (DUF983 family)